ncbi:MAG: tyrosine-type recombinase/integrase [archaeon]|jgi:site-specific recombinase XerD
MENNFDIHDHAKTIAAYCAKIPTSEFICEASKPVLLDYHRANVMDGLALPTQLKHLQAMYHLAKQLKEKPLLSLEKKDIEELVFQIRSSPKSLSTKQKYLICMKKFYKWANGGTYPEKIAWVHVKKSISDQKLPEDLLTLEEVKRMLNVCENDRDRCFISLLNELGCRIGEILPIKVKHFVQDGQLAHITMQKSKTKPRSLIVIDSVQYVGRWLNKHPTKDPEDSLFVGIGAKNKGKRWSYSAAVMALRKIAKRANVKKGVNPHNFRHSTATRYAQRMLDAQLNSWFGWVQGSSVSRTYVHLAGGDSDNVALEMRGMKKREDNKLTMGQLDCKYCGTVNPGNLDFCEKCGSAITVIGGLKKDSEAELFRKEMEARQKVLEEYLKYQNERMQKLEDALKETEKLKIQNK